MREPRGISLPWSRAPKAARASTLTAFVAAVTTLLACFLASSAVLIASAAGGAATDYESALACPDAYGPVFSRTSLPVASAPAVIDTIRRQAAAHGFPAPVASLYTGVFFADFGPAARRKVTLGYRDGGLGQVRVVQPAAAPGLWIGDDLTRFAPVRPGDPVAGGLLPPVAGVYHALTVPPPRWWCSQQRDAVVDRLVNDPLNTVAFASDAKTFYAAVSAMRAPTLSNVYISFYLPAPRTPGAAREDVDRSRALMAAVDADLSAHGLGDSISMRAPFERSAQIAGQARSNVLVSILPLAVISVLVGVGGIATVALQWYQRRRPQVRLLAARGHAPPALGGLAVAELGLPLLAGGIAGILVARLALSRYAPPGQVSAGAQAAAAGIAAGVLVVSLVLLGVVVAVRAHREFEVGRLPRLRVRLRLAAVFPWELVTAGLALLGWNRLSGYGASSRLGVPLPQVDPLALTYPVLVVLTAGLLAARLAWLLLRASHRLRWWSKPVLQLAIRRLAAARAPVTGVLVVGVLAIGALAAGSGIASGQRAALDTKTGVLVGGHSRADVETTVGLGQVPVPAAVRGESTLIGRTSGSGGVVLVVDPATLAAGAYLGSERDQITTLLPKLATPTANGLPAVRIGRAPNQTLPGLPPADTVAQLPWFPTLGNSPGYVVSRTALTADQLSGIPQWSLVSSAPVDRLEAALLAAGTQPISPTSQDTALDALPFYVVEWTFSFVTVLGGVLGVVAVLGLFVAVEARRRQNALAGTLVLRMGMSARALFASHLVELGALAGLATLVGVACGLTVADLAVPGFDPVRWLAPRSVLPDQTTFVVAMVAAALVLVLAAGRLAVRSVRTATTAELLRG